MNGFFLNLVQYFSVPILGCVFFLLFTGSSRSLDKTVQRHFDRCAILTVLLSVSDAVQGTCADLPYPTHLRMLAAAFSYTLRVSVIFSFLLVYRRRTSKKSQVLLTLPLVLTALAAFSAFVTKYSFYYTEDNVIVRGPLIVMPFLASALYFLIMLLNAFRSERLGEHRESIMVGMIFSAATAGTVLEMLGDLHGLLAGLCCISIFFYYLFFLMDNFSHDPITDSYTRQRMVQDFARVHRSYGLIMLDIAGLNAVHEEEGHAEIDKALTTVCRAVQKCLGPFARLYRLDTFTFAVVLVTDNERAASALMQRIRHTMASVPYAAGIGYVFSKGTESLESVLARADAMVELDKKKKKTYYI